MGAGRGWWRGALDADHHRHAGVEVLADRQLAERVHAVVRLLDGEEAAAEGEQGAEVLAAMRGGSRSASLRIAVGLS